MSYTYSFRELKYFTCRKKMRSYIKRKQKHLFLLSVRCWNLHDGEGEMERVFMGAGNGYNRDSPAWIFRALA